MSYVKTTWADDDIITAEGMNNIENGIEANDTACAANKVLFVPFTVTMDGTTPVGSTTATLADTLAAVVAGRNVIAKVTLPDSNGLVLAQLSLIDNAETPTSLWFSVVADLAESWETAAPTLYQIEWTSAAISVKTEALAIAT